MTGLSYGAAMDPGFVPPGRGGRVGQQHRAKPDDLREYDVTPAGEVTVTRADGTTVTRPPRAARATPPPPARPAGRRPLVCAMCADPNPADITVTRSRDPDVRGKPVHPACERRALTANRETILRRNAEKKEKAARRAAATAAGTRRMSLAEENLYLREAQARMRVVPRRAKP